MLSPVLEADYAQTTIYVDADAEILIDGQLKGKKKWSGPLKAGKYVVECRQVGHRPSSRIVLVEADKSETFEIPAPIAITGSMYVSSAPSGAEIFVDGVAHGTSPKLVQGVLIGEHDVALSLQNHKTEHRKVAVKEDETINISVKLSDVADMTIGSYPTNAELSINGEMVGKTPFRNRMSSGDYDIELFHKNYEVYRNRVHLDSSNPSLLIRMKKQYQRPCSFYIQPFVQLGGNMSVGGSLGGYISNVNVEGYYAISTKESEMIYWNTTSENGKTCGYSYMASCIGGKVGYGLILNRTMRVTPQLGVEVINLNSSKEYNVSVSFDASKANVVKASIGVKYEYAFTNNIGAFVVPACSFALKKSDYFSDMEQVSSIIKAYVSIFSLRTGVSIFF